MNAAREKVEHEGACRVCAETRLWLLEAAHVIDRSLAPGQGFEDPDAIVPLCRTCHRSYDAYELDLLPYLTREEQTHAVSLQGLVGAYVRTTGERGLPSVGAMLARGDGTAFDA